MPDADRSSLRRLVEEGAGAAQQPPLEHLRQRVIRRRTHRKLTGAALVAMILAAPAAWYFNVGAGSGPAVSAAAAPTPAIAMTARTASPPLTPQQKALLAQQAGALTVVPASVVAGGTVTVSGRGCAPDRAVSLGSGPNVGAGVVVTVHADPSGSFQGAVAIPLEAGTGVRRLWAQCELPTAGSPAAQYGAVYIFEY
jgi:hypothetical protein